MLFPFLAVLSLIVVAVAGLSFLLNMRALKATQASAGVLEADRYRPMLRLLADDDLAFACFDAKLQKSMRARRRQLFRDYLRCLTRDYGHLLAGLRGVVVESGIDRPDLVKALAKNRMLFALAVCKVEFRLQLHAVGIGKVDISGLVEALEVLRTQVRVLA